MQHTGTTSAGSPYRTSRNVPRPRKDSDSSLASEDSLQGHPRNQGSKFPSAMRPHTSSKKSGEDTSPEDGDDEEGEDEAEDSDEEEPDTVAPFGGSSSKRGHQTGLSLSLTNTSLGKRGRSPASEGNDERPTSKMSRTSEATAETSDDDAAYAALDEDDFSDQDDEENFEQDEEEEIIRGAEDEQTQWANRHGSFSSVDSFFGMLGEDEPNLFPTDTQRNTTFFGEELARTELSHRRSSMAVSTAGENADPDVPIRRVRFADEVTRSSSSTESEDEAPVYPDLFLPQDQLDPGFRRFLELSNDPQNSDSEDSFSEFANDDRTIEELDDDADSESGSSGYETDEGETTDEDVVPLDRVNPATVLHVGASGKPRAPPTPACTPVRRRVNVARRGPTMGTFAAVEDKPTIVVDGHGKHMLFYPSLKEQRERKSAQSAPVDSSQGLGHSQSHIGNSNVSDLDFALSDPMMTMFSSPADAMVSAFNGPRNQHVSSMSTQVVGPTEAFFPFVQVNKDGSVHMEDDDSFQGISSSDDIDDIVFEQFIHTEGHSTGEEDNGEPDEPSSNSTALEEEEDNDKTPQPAPKFTPTRSREPSTPTPVHQPGSLLSHFDRGVASSFRRNADRHKDWTRSPVNAGIKGGRFEVANSPLAPLRRRRGMSAATASQLTKSQSLQTTAALSGHKFPFDGPLRKRIRDANKIKKRRGSN